MFLKLLFVCPHLSKFLSTLPGSIPITHGVCKNLLGKGKWWINILWPQWSNWGGEVISFRSRMKKSSFKEIFLSQSPENSSAFQFQCILHCLLPHLPDGKSLFPSNLFPPRDNRLQPDCVNAAAVYGDPKILVKGNYSPIITFPSLTQTYFSSFALISCFSNLILLITILFKSQLNLQPFPTWTPNRWNMSLNTNLVTYLGMNSVIELCTRTIQCDICMQI